MSPLTPGPEPAISIEQATPAEIEGAWSGPGDGPSWESTFPDGCQVRFHSGVSGDHRLAYGDRALFHLSSDGRTLLCAPADFSEPSWKRFLLDTVLWSVSLINGCDALHASAIDRPEGVVAFVARTGGGKTSLAAELVRRGRHLFSDDVVALRREDGQIRAHPGPLLMNLPVAADRGSTAPIGATLGEFDDESWVALAPAAAESRSMGAIYLLDRRPGLQPAVERMAATALDLLPHSIALHKDAERQRGRFELFSDLATEVPIYALKADVTATPADLADLVERGAP